MGLRRAAVVLEGPQQGIGVVHITGAVELAGAIAAQVIAKRRDGAATIFARIVRDNAVLQGRSAAVRDAASRISANCAVIHRQVRTIGDGATWGSAHSGTGGVIPFDGAVVQRYCAGDAVNGAATHPAGEGSRATPYTGTVAGESTVLNHQQRAAVVDAAAKSEATSCAVRTREIPADDAVADCQRARIVDTPT